MEENEPVTDCHRLGIKRKLTGDNPSPVGIVGLFNWSSWKNNYKVLRNEKIVYLQISYKPKK